MKIREWAEENKQTIRILGAILLFTGFMVFFLNYERQTLDLKDVTLEKIIIDYYAPLWDPLPHHVRVNVETNEPVEVRATIDDAAPSVASLKTDEKTFDVYPGETIRITLLNKNMANGFVKTVLWCDSWNYAAALLIISGLIVLFLQSASTLGARKKRIRV